MGKEAIVYILEAFTGTTFQWNHTKWEIGMFKFAALVIQSTFQCTSTFNHLQSMNNVTKHTAKMRVM